MPCISRGPGLFQQVRIIIHNTTRPPCSARPSQPSPSSRLLLRIHLLRSSRFLQTSARSRLAAKPAAAAAAARPSPAVPRASGFIDQLARKSQPTILYEAPSHMWYRFSSITAGVFCVTYSMVNYWAIYVRPPSDITWWVPHAYSVVLVFMVAMGGYFAMGASGIVRLVRAVPYAQAEALAPAAVRKLKTSAAAQPVLLEISLSRPVPFMAPRKLYVPPSEVAMPFRMSMLEYSDSAPPATGRALLMKRKAEEEEARKKREYEMSHLLTAPFRHMAAGAKTAWLGIRRSFYREGFAKFYIRGVQYRLDILGGWALDNGRALDRIVGTKIQA